MIQQPAGGKQANKQSHIPVKDKQGGGKTAPTPTIVEPPSKPEPSPESSPSKNIAPAANGEQAEDEIMRKRKEFMEKQQKGKSIKAPTASP